MLLSNTFPQMTEEEKELYIRHGGGYTVSWFEPKVNSSVASKYCSIECFIDKNGLLDSPGYIDLIRYAVEMTGKYELELNGIMQGVYKP